MNIVADMSLYPLKDGPVPDIIEFIREMREQRWHRNCHQPAEHPVTW